MIRLKAPAVLSAARLHLAAVAVLAMLLTPALSAEPPAPAGVTPDNLDRSIRQTIDKREYKWRLPRESKEDRILNGRKSDFWKSLDETVVKALDKIHDWAVAAAKWLRKLFRGESRPNSMKAPDLNWSASMEALIMVLIAVVASILAIMLYRLWKRRSKPPASVEAKAVASVPDLTDENVPADKFEADEWMTLASDLIARGEFRLAIRAMFLACLTGLARREQVTIRRFKSNREYLRELARKAHDAPARLDAFSKNVTVLEQIWYGQHPATITTVNEFAGNQEIILHEAAKK